MKTVFKILLAPLFWLFQACSPLGSPVDEEKSDNHYYNNSNTNIRYSPMGNWFELGNTAMQADVESFEVLNRFLSRDKNHIFFEANKVENLEVEPATITVKNGTYMTDIAFDKDHVYTFEKVYTDEGQLSFARVVEGANPQTYIRTDWGWANDQKYHYYRDTKIDADFDSFEVINEYFVKDGHRVFSRNKKEFNPVAASVSTFQILDESVHGIDELNVYWKPFFKNKSRGLITISYENIEEVEAMNAYFLKIGNTIYFDGLPKTNIDAQSFEIIDHSYAKDSKHVYFKDSIVQGADPASFRKMNQNFKYKDKNGIYNEGKLEE